MRPTLPKRSDVNSGDGQSPKGEGIPVPLDHIDFNRRGVKIPAGERDFLKWLLPTLYVVGWVAVAVLSLWVAFLVRDSLVSTRPVAPAPSLVEAP